MESIRRDVLRMSQRNRMSAGLFCPGIVTEQGIAIPCVVSADASHNRAVLVDTTVTDVHALRIDRAAQGQGVTTAYVCYFGNQVCLFHDASI